MSDLLPISLLARYLRVSPAWLRAEAEAKRLPAIDAGKGQFLFSRETVERVLLERAQQHEEGTP